MPHIMKHINTVSRCQAMYRSRMIEEISGNHHLYFYAVCSKPGRSQEELAEDLNLNKSSVTRSLCRLEQQGFVERKESIEDKRRMLVYPTEKMLLMLPQIRETAGQWSELISEGIDEEQMKIFASVLEKIAERAKQIIKEDTSE